MARRSAEHLHEIDAFGVVDRAPALVGFGFRYVSPYGHETRESLLVRVKRYLDRDSFWSDRSEAEKAFEASRVMGSSSPIDAARTMRLYCSAATYLRRVKELGACTDKQIGEMAHRFVDQLGVRARAEIATLAWRAYRSHHIKRSDIPRKFSNEQARSIREMYAAGGWTFKTLAAAFGVSGRLISQILYGEIYKAAGGPIHAPVWD